jgi:phosphocarrier protein HPr
VISKDYVILDPHGMHARPAATLMKLGKQYKSLISLKKDEKEIRIISIFNILSLSLKCGETISVIIEGEDESDAATAVDYFFNEELK